MYEWYDCCGVACESHFLEDWHISEPKHDVFAWVFFYFFFFTQIWVICMLLWSIQNCGENYAFKILSYHVKYKLYVGQTNGQQAWLNLNEPMKNNLFSFFLLLLSVLLFCFCIFLVATMTAALSNMGTLSSLLPLPSITNKPPPVPTQSNISALDEVKRKVAKQANSISIKEFTDVRLYSLYDTC